ncbi:MAG: glycosyltransferase family 39 protein [Candidatus Uhrbacteria bacterium]
MQLRHLTYREIFLLVVAAAFFIFQIHQLLSFNPYWGYDGGAHVNILETLLFQHHFPALADNYLAWHEPFYYLFLVGLGFLGIPFWFSHLIIVLAIDFLVFKLFRRFKLSDELSLFGSLTALSLPAFLEVSMFFTNEALNYVFLLAIMHLAIILFQETKWSWKTSLLLAGCVGLGVITKITALVAFGVVVILLIIKMIENRTWKYLITIVLALVVSAIFYLPWYLIRSDGLAQVSINNYDMLPAKPLVWDERVSFMTRFDADIFSFPFWYSGGTGFWSMLYADTVSDYLGLFENQDIKNALPETERVKTTHNGNSVSAYRKPLAEWVMRLGVIPVGLLILGLGYAFWLIIKKQKKLFFVALPTLGFFSAFLLAAMYYAYRYPYYDQGVIKSIFIGPAFVLPLAMVIVCLKRAPRWALYGILVLWSMYIIISLALFFIR